ncbi:MAG: L,D-transpeptidase [Zoogloeaceae bacterium]|nr:L,D-transpeptidase [Zoogloeaceae bacterium]MCK6383386.1 L,D-transpeptidase [Rhodocyclaceae bacterium]
MNASNALCFSVALANTRAFDDNAGCPRPILVPRVDKLVVDKARRRLRLMGRGRVVRSYRVSLGATSSAPAGRYLIIGRNPKSPNHLALRLARQAPSAAEHAGGGLQLHGTPSWLGPLAVALKGSDWTTGGIGLANADIEEVWNLVQDGTPVVIRP